LHTGVLLLMDGRCAARAVHTSMLAPTNL